MSTHSKGRSDVYDKPPVPSAAATKTPRYSHTRHDHSPNATYDASSEPAEPPDPLQSPSPHDGTGLEEIRTASLLGISAPEVQSVDSSKLAQSAAASSNASKLTSERKSATRAMCASFPRRAHSPYATYDTSSNTAAPPDPPAPPSPRDDTGTDLAVTRTASRVVNSSPEVQSVGNSKQTRSATTSANASEPPSERKSPIADSIRSDPSSVVFYYPETRTFTACKQVTSVPPVATPLSSREGQLLLEKWPIPPQVPAPPARSSSNESDTSSHLAGAPSSRAFVLKFPQDWKAPERVASLLVKAEESDGRVQPPCQDEVPTTIATTESPPVSSRSEQDNSRFCFAHFAAERAMSADPHQQRPTTSTNESTSIKPTKARDKRPPISRLKLLQRAVRSGKPLPFEGITLTDLAESFKATSWEHRTRKSQSPSPPVEPHIVEEPNLKRGTLRKSRRPSSPVESHVVGEQNVGGMPVFREQDVDRLVYRESFLYPVAFCLLLVFIVGFAVLIWPRPRSNNSTEALRSVCKSSSCLRDSLYLDNLLSWDEVNPCDDFYSFVCRRWTSQFATSSAGDSVSVDDDYAAYAEGKLHAYIQDISRLPSTARALSDLHAMCMDSKRTQDEGWEAFLQLLFQVSLEGFPFTPPIRSTISVWKTAAELLRLAGSAALLGVGVASNPSGKDVASVRPPEMLTSGVGRMDINDAVRLYTTAVFAAVKALRKEYLPPAYALNVVKFATDIEKLSEMGTLGGGYKLLVVDSSSPLLEFLTVALAGVRGTSPIFGGPGSEIAVEAPLVVDRIVALAREEQPHTVLNYLCVRLMIQTSAFIPQSDLTDFYTTLAYGKRRAALPRWELCVRVVEKALFPLVSASLLANLRTPVAKFTDLANEIVEEFQRTIAASTYFDDSSKGAIRTLLSSTQIRVLSPAWLSDPGLIQGYAQRLPSISGSLNGLETYLAVHEYTFLDSLARGSAQRWRRSAFSADCWFEPYPMTVYVPLLAFNVSQAFEDTSSPLQVARIGPRIGRCLFGMLMLLLANGEGGGNASSTQGPGRNWLTASTLSKLQGAESCLEARPPAAASVFPRCRDVLAMGASYAHFAKRSSDPLSLRLAGQRVLTNGQLFFIYIVLQTCEKTSGQRQLRTEAGYGWKVAMRNSRDFSDSFKCSPDEAMSLPNKCSS